MRRVRRGERTRNRKRRAFVCRVESRERRSKGGAGVRFGPRATGARTEPDPGPAFRAFPNSPQLQQTRAAFGFGFAPRVEPASPRLTPTSPPFNDEQDTVTSMVIPLAFAATGATLLVKGLDDLSYGKNKKEGF